MSLSSLKEHELCLKKQLDEVTEKIYTLSQHREKLKSEYEEIKHEIALATVASLHPSDGFSDYSAANYFPWSAELARIRNELFRIDDFRPLQLVAINALLDHRDIILVMPTGAGKSLVYQLPSFLTAPDHSIQFTLVISPLVSLMTDQAMGLQRLGVPAGSVAVLDSNTPAAQQQRIFLEISGDSLPKDESSTIRLLYVTPEKLSKSKRLINRLEKAYARKRLARIAIDEVHCVSQWGHDFRPDYKFLHVLRKQFPLVPILGLTATASAEVIIDVQTMLGLQLNSCLVLRTGYNRPNLFYEVKFQTGSPAATYPQIVQLIKTEFNGQSGIVYCLSQKDTEDTATYLSEEGIDAAFYHANLPPDRRLRVHNSWVDGKIKVVVATVAFGMGIDKSNVRFVIHLSMSKSIENYYQESGRAGRDGLPGARVVLFFRLADVSRLACMVFAEQKNGVAKLMDTLGYALEPKECRRKLLSAGLGDASWKPEDCDRACDNCLLCSAVKMHPNSVDVIALLSDVDDILAKQHVSATNQRITAAKLVDIMVKKKVTVDTCRQLGGSGSRLECVRLSEYFVTWCLFKTYIRLQFHFTAYSTIAYVCASENTKTQIDRMCVSCRFFESSHRLSTATLPRVSGVSLKRAADLQPPIELDSD